MNKIVTLITGASGGIGEEFAYEFAKNGQNLLLIARNGEKLAQVAAQIKQQYAVDVDILPLDLSARDAANTLVTYLVDANMEVEHLVNNAGFGLNDAVQTLSVDEQLNLLDLNVRSLTELSSLLLEQVIKHKGGLLNVASILGFIPVPYMAAYGASKAYVLSFTEALAVECQNVDVKICVVCPGSTATGFGERAKYNRSEMLENAAMMSAKQVANIGYKGYMRGKTIVVTGTTNKLIPILARLLPRKLIRKFVGRMMTSD